MPDRDKLQGFIFDQFDIRGEILTLEHSYGEAIARGNYPQLIKQLLGEFMAAAGMLSATLKFDGVLTLQAQGPGPLSMIMADCTRHHNLRAIASFDRAYDFNTDESLAALVGKGTLSLTIDPSNASATRALCHWSQRISPTVCRITSLARNNSEPGSGWRPTLNLIHQGLPACCFRHCPGSWKRRRKKICRCGNTPHNWPARSRPKSS